MFQMKLSVHCSCWSVLCAGLTFVFLFFSFTASTTLTVITHLGDAGFVACGKLFAHTYMQVLKSTPFSLPGWMQFFKSGVQFGFCIDVHSCNYEKRFQMPTALLSANLVLWTVPPAKHLFLPRCPYWVVNTDLCKRCFLYSCMKHKF